MPATKKPNELEPIEASKIYPLAVFQKHSGLGRHALREMRRKGLRTITAGGRKYVRGADFFAYMAGIEDSRACGGRGA